jgi:hypothetical protein
MSQSHPSCQIIPPYLMDKVASPEAIARDRALRAQRAAAPAVPPKQAAAGVAAFVVDTAKNGTDLPGELVRSAGDPESGDQAVDEAYTGVEGTLALYREVYGRDSYDGKGAQVVTTVHYDKDYDNAFWDGTQLVIGDGDGKVFERFTIAVDVLGHELSHALTQFTANLTYQGQPGALNESVSDVFGSCLKQRLKSQSADEADWLIGEGIFKPDIAGTALRSMKEPGTAYDDPTLGKDPQVASMDDYVVTSDDNGGVHTNSGIPNKAFYLAATGIGGTSWDGAGAIWYTALTSGISADTDFAGFAAATATAAAAVSAEAEAAVTQAWTSVGVTAVAGSTAAPTTGGGSTTRTVKVTRSGGFAGIVQTGELALGDDPRTPEVESLLGRIDFAAVAAHQPQPDRFVFTFDVDGRQTVVGEQDLTSDQQQLATLLLPR